MASTRVTVLVGTTKGAFLISDNDAGAWGRPRSILQRLADQSRDRRSRDGRHLGGRRW